MVTMNKSNAAPRLPLDLYQLRAFFAVAQTLNFTEAARRLCVTQPAVSHAVKKLQRSAGDQLFKKPPRGLELTEAGRILYKACETVFYELEKAQEQLAGRRGGGTIKLGATVEFGTTLLVKYLKGFIAANPGVHVDFTFSHELLRPLLNDELDMVIDCREHRVEGIDRRPLFREEYAVIASPEFIRRRGLKEPKDLERCPVLSLDKAGRWWGNFLNALPVAERPEFRDITQMTHIRAVINAAMEGMGAGFVPRYCVLKELRSGALADVFPRLKLLEDYFYLYQKSGKAGLARHKALAEYLLHIKSTQLSKA
ncbi:MAG: LysR family transcriptional regulator [Elusimicrobiales bacterium]|nr:LysR family transcriptional regulator [Elusimicrobiales bacterium]